MCNSPQLWNCKAKLSIVWTLYNSKCTCASARLGLYCSCISTDRKKKRASKEPTNRQTTELFQLEKLIAHSSVHTRRREAQRLAGRWRSSPSPRAREREQRTNERTNEWTEGRTEVLNIRSNCGRRRAGGGRVREGYIELRQIPAYPGKDIKESICV